MLASRPAASIKDEPYLVAGKRVKVESSSSRK